MFIDDYRLYILSSESRLLDAYVRLRASVLAADTRVMPLTSFAQGALGSGLVPVPLTPGDLADGLLRVSIQKGLRTRSSTICDDRFYDASVPIMLVKLP